MSSHQRHKVIPESGPRSRKEATTGPSATQRIATLRGIEGSFMPIYTSLSSLKSDPYAGIAQGESGRYFGTKNAVSLLPAAWLVAKCSSCLWRTCVAWERLDAVRETSCHPVSLDTVRFFVHCLRRIVVVASRRLWQHFYAFSH